MRPVKEGFSSAIFWLRTGFLCLDTVFPIYTLKNMMVLCRYGRIMDQLERERDLDTLQSEIREDHGVHSALARFKVLKFVENPLMRDGDTLLARIVSY